MNSLNPFEEKRDFCNLSLSESENLQFDTEEEFLSQKLLKHANIKNVLFVGQEKHFKFGSKNIWKI